MSKHGIQITSQRIGSLEKELIKYSLDIPKSSLVLDLGGGNGFISIILSLIQKQVYYYDLKIDFKLKIFKKLFSSKKLNLIKKDLKKIKYIDFPKNIDIIYSARFFHYLTYKESDDLLKKLSKNLKKDGKIFLTLSGIDSNIGINYKCKDIKIEERSCFLSKSNQSRFKIKEKVTLYKKEELENLIKKYFNIQEVWESDFKNIFVIAVKK